MPSSFRPPLQQRSAATLDRIVRAAEELFAERGFDATTVDDIVARAGSSKGSFYSRFSDKEALLAYIGGECLARAKAQWAELLDPQRLAGVPIARIVDAIVGRLLDDYRGDDAAVLRALTIEARLRPGNDFERMTDELDDHIRTALERLLRARSGDLGAVSPRVAARVGLLMCDATIRESVLFATDRGGPLAVEDGKLRRELVRAFVAYLGA